MSILEDSKCVDEAMLTLTVESLVTGKKKKRNRVKREHYRYLSSKFFGESLVFESDM